MLEVAKDIERICADPNTGKSKLDVVVATHRHKDHISGFATKKTGDGPGDIIRRLAPAVVIQPWTEDPKADAKAKRANGSAKAQVKPGKAAFRAMLGEMHAVAGFAMAFVERRPDLSRTVAAKLRFLADDNIANASAVHNLIEMGSQGRAYYVRCGDKVGLARQLPGVRVTVLGPPDLTQTEQILKQAARNADEFWHFASGWNALGLAARKTDAPGSSFRLAARAASVPPYARWFTRAAKNVHAEQLLEIVRELDRQMNNTSLILLLEVGEAKLLFPGDAQIENWMYALGQEKFRTMLSGVNVYKVGHHGSLNATPKTLWRLMNSDRLVSLMSTKSGKHGEPSRGTEVPCSKLVDALKQKSTLHNTEDFDGAEMLVKEIAIPI
jgi:hypothetical protein